MVFQQEDEKSYFHLLLQLHSIVTTTTQFLCLNTRRLSGGGRERKEGVKGRREKKGKKERKKEKDRERRESVWQGYKMVESPGFSMFIALVLCGSVLAAALETSSKEWIPYANRIIDGSFLQTVM